MSGAVLDASMALAWCFPDEASADADRVLVALEGETIFVPAVWSLEIANAFPPKCRNSDRTGAKFD